MQDDLTQNKHSVWHCGCVVLGFINRSVLVQGLVITAVKKHQLPSPAKETNMLLEKWSESEMQLESNPSLES